MCLRSKSKFPLLIRPKVVIVNLSELTVHLFVTFHVQNACNLSLVVSFAHLDQVRLEHLVGSLQFGGIRYRRDHGRHL